MRHNDIDIYCIYIYIFFPSAFWDLRRGCSDEFGKGNIYMLSVYHIQITSYLHASAFLNTPLPQVSRCRFGPSQLS